MKNTYSLGTRNAIVEANLHRIDKVMRRNRGLIRAARMDRDDVYQQLAIRLIRAVDSFDPEKGTLGQHIDAQLQYEMLNCKRPYRLHGVTGLPADYRGGQIISFESIHDGSRYADALIAARGAYMLKQPLKWQWPYRGVLCKLYEWLGFVLQGHPATVREYRLERELEEKRRNIRFLQNQLRYTRADNFDYAQLPMQYRDTLADIFCYPLEILRDSPHFQVREAQDKSSWDVVTEQCCLGGCDLSIYTLPSERDALLYAAVLHAVGYRPPNNKACEACYEKYMKTKIKRRHQK